MSKLNEAEIKQYMLTGLTREEAVQEILYWLAVEHTARS